MRLASDAGVPEATARHRRQHRRACRAFARLAGDAPIRAATVRSISRVIGADGDRLA